jgi:predicted anti-sigma-YlaC factor YlaD
MSTMDCETVRQAAMALADGETGPLNAEQIQRHLADCPECRIAVERLASLTRVLDGQSRREPAIDLWPRVRNQLAPPARFPLAGRFALLAATLLLARGIILVTAEPVEWIVRAVALLLVGTWFVWSQENPFTIQTHLFETKETRP